MGGESGFRIDVERWLEEFSIRLLYPNRSPICRLRCARFRDSGRSLIRSTRHNHYSFALAFACYGPDNHRN